jgi:hypothetical protein
MPPPVRVPTVGASRHPLFPPPRHAGQPLGSGDEGFGDPLTPARGSNPRTARTASRGRGRDDNSHPSGGKVKNTLPTCSVHVK